MGDMDYLAGEDTMVSQRGSDLCWDGVNPTELLGHTRYPVTILSSKFISCNPAAQN